MERSEIREPRETTVLDFAAPQPGLSVSQTKQS
jgi:hypothetical protein